MRTKRALALATILALPACKSHPPPEQDDPGPAEPAATGKAKTGSAATDLPDPAPRPDPEQARAEQEQAAHDEGPSLHELGQPRARLKVNAPAPVLYRKAKNAHRDDDDDETARELLDEALEADPHFAWALLMRARLHLREAEKRECLADLERLVAYNYMEYAPRIRRWGWLEPLREDDELWPAFQDRMEAYRQAWIDALDGPGAFFIQSRYKKVEQTDEEGEAVDLRWKRGSLVFWSKDLDRLLVLGEPTNVAGFLHDRQNRKLVFVRWEPHPDPTAGMMGIITAQRMDLSTLETEGQPVILAAAADEARFALGEKGELLFEMHVPPDEAIHDTVKQAETETTPKTAPEPAKTGEPTDDEDAEEGVEVDALDWSSSEIEGIAMDEDRQWQLVIRLGETLGPPPVSVEDAPGEPHTVRHGRCHYIDAETAFCFAPTKKGGTWAHLTLHPAGGDPVQLTDDPIPLVQF